LSLFLHLTTSICLAFFVPIPDCTPPARESFLFLFVRIDKERMICQDSGGFFYRLGVRRGTYRAGDVSIQLADLAREFLTHDEQFEVRPS